MGKNAPDVNYCAVFVDVVVAIVAGVCSLSAPSMGTAAALVSMWTADICAPVTTANDSGPNLRLVVENYVQQGTVDFNVTVVINKTQFPKFVHEKTYARSRRANHFASVSWLIFAIIGSGRPSLPKFARSRRTRARRFSLELKS